MSDLKIYVGDKFLSESRIKNFSKENEIQNTFNIYENFEEIGALLDGSIFDERSMYIIHDPKKEVLDFIEKNIKSFSSLKFISILLDSSAPDGRMSFYKKNNTKIINSGYLEYADKNSLFNFINQIVDIEKAALNEFVSRMCPIEKKIDKKNVLVWNLQKIYSELEKLEISSNGEIKKEEVQELVEREYLSSYWKIIDGIFSKNYLIAVKNYFLCSSSLDDAMKIVGLIISEIRLLLVVSNLVELYDLDTERDVIKILSKNVWKDKYLMNVTADESTPRIQYHPYRIKKMFFISKNYNKDTIKNMLNYSLGCLIELRQSKPYENLLTNLLYELCES